MKYSRTLSKQQRKTLADELRGHRKLAFRRPSIIYADFSNLRFLRKVSGLDLASIIAAKLRGWDKHRKLRFFDSGSGALGVEADLRKIFGNRIEITALTLRHPNVSFKTRQRIKRDIMEDNKSHLPEQIKSMTRAHSRSITQAKKNIASVDSLHIGAMQDFSSRKKFDIIFDYNGPGTGGWFTGQVFHKYSEMLPKGGILITNMSSAELEFTKKEIIKGFSCEYFGKYAVLTKL